MTKLIDKVDELKKRLIIDTANKYFKLFGYEKTQIDKISKELGVGVGTIYGYFKSKEGLFLAWLGSIIENAYEEIKLICSDVKDPIKKLEKIAEYKFQYFEKNKTTIKAYMENNQLFLRGISRRKEHPMAPVYWYCADIIKNIKKMSDDSAYLFANIFDSMINCYIECSLENEDLLGKEKEVVKRFLATLEVKS